MAVSTAVLRELHRIHSQLSDLRERLERGPRRVQAHRANVAQQQAKLSAAQECVKQTKLTADRKQLDLKTGDNRILDLKTKLNTCSSNKEYQALVEQIAAAEMAGSVLADEILEAFEKVDVLEVKVEEEKKTLAATERELAKCETSVAAEKGVVQGDVERLEVELVEAEKNLPAEIRADYERIIQNKGADGMAEVENQICLGCGYQITLNMLNELLLSRPVFCKSCGCLLYCGEN